MLRLILTEIALFAVPFALYALWVWLVRRVGRDSGPAGVARLTALALAGLVMMAAGFLVLGAFSDEKVGTYRPAEFRDGVLVPGRIE